MEENIQRLQARADFLRNLKSKLLETKNYQILNKKKVLQQDFEVLKPSHEDYVNQEQAMTQESLSYQELNYVELNNVNYPCDLMCHEELPLSGDEVPDVAPLDRTTLDPFFDSDNSKDADYVPEVKDDSDVSCDFICESPTEKVVILSNVLLKSKNTPANQPTINSDNHCEYFECNGEVFSSCGYCECYLCWEHFNDGVAYKNCKMHKKYVPHESLPRDVASQKNIYQNGTNEDGQHCEFINCTNKVYCTCSACFCLLCLDHLTFTELECMKHRPHATDEIAEPLRTQKGTIRKKNTYVNYKVTKKESFAQCDKQFGGGISTNEMMQHCEFVECTKKANSTCTECFCLLCLDHFTSTELKCSEHRPYTTTTLITGPVLTMKGTLRKRKLHDEYLYIRHNKKVKIQEEKMSLKPPCKEGCRKKCTSMFSEIERKKIHGEYNNLDRISQSIYIKRLVNEKPVNRRKQSAAIKKNITYVYNFIKENDGKKEVCKTFFLSTLGYDAKNDTRVLAAISKPIEKQKDLRGSYERKHKIDRTIVKTHVMKYNPSISHYRREHAPNRLYLPSDINITMMFNDFRSEHPDIKISCEIYRKIVRHDLNISFAHLGHEECETCQIFKQHDKCHFLSPSETCQVCQNFQLLKSKYITCRKEYQIDVETSKNCSKNDMEIIFYSVDLQKVIMLPRMEQFKAALFCPRIIGYNESFVPLGPCSSSRIPFAAIWPETVSGRGQEDIISAFRAFLIHVRDFKHIVLWMDNCASQNKNWAMFSFLVYIINSNEIGTDTITFKYLEPGHTFMSADSFHHQVELSMQHKKIYDFDDFAKAVKQANSKKNHVKEMNISDFFYFKDLSSQVRLKKREPRCYLKDVMSVKAQRGQFHLTYKTCHSGTEHILDFLTTKIIKSKRFPQFSPKSTPRGIDDDKKKEILKKLVPLMPENRKIFWYNLPSNN